MKLLVVEDDEDGREVLTELFRIHGWDVTDVPSVRAALDALRRIHFDVVISDENVFGESGSTMLHEANAAGLLDHVGVLLYTADPRDPDVPAKVRVLHKPLGIEALVHVAEELVDEASPPSAA
jgi:DNA-binding response OmpR family regulator